MTDMLSRLQQRLGRCADCCEHWQRQAVGLLVAMTLALILLNVITRSLQMALFWVDEAAVYCMIWAFMLGAAVTVRSREGIAVNLVNDALGQRGQLRLRLLADLLVLCFTAILLACNWLWFDPGLLLAVEFDGAEFIRRSFNFVYRDPTSTLGISKFWIWLIMPVMALSLLLYSLANSLDSLVALQRERAS